MTSLVILQVWKITITHMMFLTHRQCRLCEKLFSSKNKIYIQHLLLILFIYCFIECLTNLRTQINKTNLLCLCTCCCWRHWCFELFCIQEKKWGRILSPLISRGHVVTDFFLIVSPYHQIDLWYFLSSQFISASLEYWWLNLWHL